MGSVAIVILVALVGLAGGAAIGWMIATRNGHQVQRLKGAQEAVLSGAPGADERSNQLAEISEHFVTQADDLDGPYHTLAEQYHARVHQLQSQLTSLPQTEATRTLKYALTVTARAWDLGQNIEQKARRMAEIRRREALTRFREAAALDEKQAELAVSGKTDPSRIPSAALIHFAIAVMAAKHAASVKRMTFRTKLSMSYAGTCLMAKATGEVDAVPAARWWEAAIDGSDFARQHIIDVFTETSPDSKRIIDRLTSELADLDAGLSKERLRRVG